MNSLEFRSGFPFAYLFFYGALLACMVTGALLLVLAARQRRGALAILGGGMLVLPLAYMALVAAFGTDIDLSPGFAVPEIVGTWRYRGATLSLQPDSTFVHTSADGRVTRGRFSVETFDIRLEPPPTPDDTLLHVVRAGDELRITREFGDPDAWDGDLGFSRISP